MCVAEGNHPVCMNTCAHSFGASRPQSSKSAFRGPLAILCFRHAVRGKDKGVCCQQCSCKFVN